MNDEIREEFKKRAIDLAVNELDHMAKREQDYREIVREVIRRSPHIPNLIDVGATVKYVARALVFHGPHKPVARNGTFEDDLFQVLQGALKRMEDDISEIEFKEAIKNNPNHPWMKGGVVHGEEVEARVSPGETVVSRGYL